MAPNPRNTRDIDTRPDKLAGLRASLRELGQMQPSACVTRSSYLALFPEDEETVPHTFEWVQVGGGRRRAALLLEGMETIEIRVRDSLAATRVSFIRAMADENLADESLDVVEEALVVQQLLAELQSGNAVAELLERTPGWVSQRKNVLLLQPEVQEQMRTSGEARLSLEEVRKGKWHLDSREEQLANLQAWRRRRGLINMDAEATPPPAPRPRVSRVQAAIQRLGKTPTAIAQTLRSELSAEQRRELANELLRD
ncbi:ParB/RepB/Spo0J family partition protein [Couchioplanes caeruleus]|uniref:ParB/RepB/Spo0J family partition protein n=1 Tax=Couchioplanes caeruleus TaxID=56438 RepID=UPI0011609688|nr:plasmid partitioning protein [Couchioplanes caeruleus]